MSLPEQQVLTLCVSKGLTVATAESCTGGLLASRLTDIAGSSDYYLGGVVSYAYSAKEELLEVDHDLLVRDGAVSDTVACWMARSIRQRLGADVGVGITGIAGPGGGSLDKPVGLVWIGLADAHGEQAKRYQWTSDRITNKQQSADAAIALLIAWAQAASSRK
jgi:nicotinamide-nucleotide amidase